MAVLAAALALVQSGAPVNVSPPRILGDPALGSTLSTDGGTWTSSERFVLSYAWQACDSAGSNCHPIRDETAATYVPKYFQVKGGETVRVAVTAWNGTGPTTATSAAVTIRGVTAVMLEAPVVTGDPHVGGTLTVSEGRWSSVEPWILTFTWLRCWPDAPNLCLTIPYAFYGRSFVLGPLDAGWLISARVAAVTRSGSSVVTTPPVFIPGTPPKTVAPHAEDLGAVMVGQYYDIGLWSGGIAPLQIVPWGTVPSGMMVTGDGHLAGRPSATGVIRFGNDITDATGRVTHTAFRIRVVPRYAATHRLTAAAVNVAIPAPTSGPCASVDPQGPQLVDEPASWDLKVGVRTRIEFLSSGMKPYVVCTLGGSLPRGLKVDAANGVVTGKPAKAGVFKVTLAAAGAQSAMTYAYIVAPAKSVKRRAQG